MIGVSFQPGTSEADQMKRREQTGSAQGVQEAIKVLSLRLPKVVGAQAAAPQALLTAPGAQGNPNVDSIVESVLSKMFGQGRQQPTAPGAPGAPMVERQQPQGWDAYKQLWQGQPVQGGPSAPQQQPPAQPQPNNFASQIQSAPRFEIGELGPTAPFRLGPNDRRPGMSGTDADLSIGGAPWGTGLIDNTPLPEIPNLRKDYLDWLDPAPSENPLI